MRHTQMVGCETGLKLTGSIVRLRNALMSDVSTNFHLSSSIAAVEHLKVNGAVRLNDAGTLYLANSLLVGYGLTNGWSGVSNVFVSSAEGVFASAGAGSNHLAAGSPYRNAGTTVIHAGLQKDFKAMTTVAAIGDQRPEFATRPGWVSGKS